MLQLGWVGFDAEQRAFKEGGAATESAMVDAITAGRLDAPLNAVEHEYVRRRLDVQRDAVLAAQDAVRVVAEARGLDPNAVMLVERGKALAFAALPKEGER